MVFSIKQLAIRLMVIGVVLGVGLGLILTDTLAQTGGRKPTNLTVTVQIRPQAIPASPTDLIRQDAYVCSADVIGTGQVVTIKDRQATPINWINAVLGAVSAPVTWPFVASQDSYCRWFPGGVTWGADTTGATGYLTIKCADGPCTLVSGF